MKPLCIAAALLVFAGAGAAQPPTAPPPREVSNSDLVFWYYGRSYYSRSEPPTQSLEMEVKGRKIEVRWTMQDATYSATASRVVVLDGVLSLIGAEKDPAVMSTNCGQTSLSGRRIDVVLADGKIKVRDTRDPKPGP